MKLCKIQYLRAKWIDLSKGFRDFKYLQHLHLLLLHLKILQNLSNIPELLV